MRKMKLALITIAIIGLVVPLFSCSSKSKGTEASTSQTVTVKRDDLTIDITAAGNLALSRTEDLAFDLFYGSTQGGTVATVAEVLVEEGDTVKKGQILASVDASQWQEELEKLEVALATKKRDLTQKQLDLVTAQQALQDAEAKYIWPTEIFTARQKVWTAESKVEEAKGVLEGSKLVWDSTIQQYRVQEAKTSYDIRVWTQKLAEAEEELGAAKLALDKLLADATAVAKVAQAQEKLRVAQAELDRLMGQSTVEVAEAEQKQTGPTSMPGASTNMTLAQPEQIAIQRTRVEMAKEQLKDAQSEISGVAQKRLSVDLAQGKLDDAQRAVADAQKNLDEAKSKSPQIVAPFDGFITKVNVEGGDEIKTGTVAMTIADPNKFEVLIPVSETDIMQVKLGQEASVRVDAMPAISLSANVTHISPTATIQSGVVNYNVKVELASLAAAMQAASQTSGNVSSGSTQQTPRPQTSANVSSGAQQFQRPSTSGNVSSGNRSLTPEQIQEAKQRQQSQAGQISGQQQTVATPTNFQLRQGMTVIVSLIVQQKSDVLMVPSTAITRQGTKRYVNVPQEGGAVEKREITTGISNSQYTEVLSGLNENEKVIVAKMTTTGSTTTSQQRPPGMMIPLR